LKDLNARNINNWFFQISLIPEYEKSQVFFTTHSKVCAYRNELGKFEVSLDREGNSQINKVRGINPRFFNIRDIFK
jgi:hypothetical protein